MAQQQQTRSEQNLSQGYEYTHKKFNWNYTHKKFGLRCEQRKAVSNENIAQPPAKQIKTDNHAKDIFRPYALDASNTPRKRKISESADVVVTSKESSFAALKTACAPSKTTVNDHNQVQSPSYPSPTVTATSSPTTSSPFESCYTPALSPNSYNMRLHRQRADHYMRYMAQARAVNFAAYRQPAFNFSINYPYVIAPIFNGCFG